MREKNGRRSCVMSHRVSARAAPGLQRRCSASPQSPFYGAAADLLILLVLYPALIAASCDAQQSMERFVGLGTSPSCSSARPFWLVVQQSCIFAITAVIFKALIGFIVAHFVHNIPAKGQRKWRGMLLVPWVIPPAMSTPRLAVAVRSVLQRIQLDAGAGRASIPVPWTGDAYWARFSVILVNVWYGAPFFMIMYLAALKSVPRAALLRRRRSTAPTGGSACGS
jgi:multiple sugar transport system permease protein